MKRKFGAWRTVSVLAATWMLVSCASTGRDDWVELKPEAAGSAPALHITGTVHHLDLEGGLYVIRDGDGKNFNPTILPEAFRVEGLAIEADAERRDELVSIGMVGPIVDLIRIRRRADVKEELLGTAWMLEDLAGAGVVDRTQATLAFSADGKASGNASCNQFHGTVTVARGRIAFGPLATTRKTCVEALMHQERRYLAALQTANRFEIKELFLYIYSTSATQPLRFIGRDESSEQSPYAPPAVAASIELTGIWTVVGHHISGASAMNDAGAKARHGKTLRLTAQEAISGGNHCDAPTYATASVDRDRYLGSEFKLPPGSLAPLAALTRINVLEVSCGGAPWAAMGGRVIGIDADHALSPWDGVFFELARDHDFRAVGQEPGWQLKIHKGKEIRFRYDYGVRVAITPAPVPEIDSADGTSVYQVVTEAGNLRVVIEPTPCTDVMSGEPFEKTVAVTFNGRKYRGCGSPLP